MMRIKSIHARTICSRTLLVILTLIPTFAVADEGGIGLFSPWPTRQSRRGTSVATMVIRKYLLSHVRERRLYKQITPDSGVPAILGSNASQALVVGSRVG